MESLSVLGYTVSQECPSPSHQARPVVTQETLGNVCITKTMLITLMMKGFRGTWNTFFYYVRCRHLINNCQGSSPGCHPFVYPLSQNQLITNKSLDVVNVVTCSFSTKL